uniref:Ras-associating domain-containing protein n=1 Tax=Trichobilharzia regenti TaxID=157069 RepID=A0AA85JHM6_TRIRE|nr:unnamed protein product [Trichobilharzia regenti]
MLNKVATLGSNTQIPRGTLPSNDRNSDKVKMPFFRKSRSTSKSRQSATSSAIWSNNNNTVVNSSTYTSNNPSEPIELSWEQVVSNDGFVKHFLKVFCERVRKGDHFKTIRIIGSTTAGLCIKELVETYYSKYGTRNDFYLCEIIGRIQPISNVKSSTPVWSFSEQKVRRIDANENIISLLQNTSPGYGLCRRLELRPVDGRINTPMNESRNLTSSQVSLRDPVTSPQLPITSPRSGTPVNGITLFKDSRRGNFFRGVQIPQGPHFLLLRGNQPNRDMLLHDLTKLIIDNTMQSFMTVGYGKHADIRLYPIPSEVRSTEGGCIIAKIVGYNITLKTSESSVKRGLVFLEPCDSNDNDDTADKTPNNSRSKYDNTEIYINNDLIKPMYSDTFQKRELRPGDLIFFGSHKRGYIYLFKDPRCIPDYKLELPFTTNQNVFDSGNNKTHGNVKILNASTSTDEIVTRASTAVIANSSDSTDDGCNGAGNPDMKKQYSSSVQQFNSPSSTSTLEEMKDDDIRSIPGINELEWIIQPLLVQLRLTDGTSVSSSSISLLSSSNSQKIVNLDTLGTWDAMETTILEPWRSACLLSLLIRAIGLNKLRSSTITTSSTNSDSKIQKNNSMEDLIKQITSILSNYQKRAELTESNRVVFQFWLSLFFYDLATYITSGWLTHDIKSPSIVVDGKDPTTVSISSATTTTSNSEHRQQDNNKSESSLSHLFGELQAPETLVEIDELRKLLYTLADQIIDKLVKTTCHSISPYIPALYQGSLNNSPVRSQSDEIRLTSPTEWTSGNSSRIELSRWLNQLVLCFDVAFYPTGGSPLSPLQNDAENLSINSSSLQSGMSSKMQNGMTQEELYNQQYHYSNPPPSNHHQHPHHHPHHQQQQQNLLTLNSRYPQKKSETSDLSMSGDSDVDNDILMMNKHSRAKS